MKKILSITIALAISLSLSTVAFAGNTINTCPYCKVFKTADAAEYDAHISSECNVKYRSCQYGCGASFNTDEEKASHEAICPEFAADCVYCGETIVSKSAYDEHLEECKSNYNNIPADKIVDTVKGVDWKAIVEKVVELVNKIDFQAIMETITPLIEKVFSLFMPLIEKVISTVIPT